MAMRRSRGVMSLTTRPPIRISPEVGSSRPAIIRRRVVLPDPAGPRRTRNSPSRLSRFTPMTAASFDFLNRLVSALVSTTAIRSCPPFGEDPLDLFFGVAHGLLRRQLVARRLGEHGGQDEGVENLVDGGGSITG